MSGTIAYGYLPATVDGETAGDLHRIAASVVAAGGAIGWPVPPSRAQFDGWLAEVGADVARGDAAVLVARQDGTAVGLGCWRRYARATLRLNADIEKVFVDPAAEGTGIGRRLAADLVAAARLAGIETLTLDARGDNARALGLYERLGFTEHGRVPRFVAFGDDRYDLVLLSLDLR